jgi:hypothetical protein
MRLPLIVAFVLFPFLRLDNQMTLVAAEAIMQEITLENYREELPKRWSKYLHALGSVEGMGTYRYFRNGELENEFTLTVVCHYPLFAQIGGQIDGGTNSVSAMGANYDFRLERENPTDAWIIENISEIGKELPSLDSWKFPEHFPLDDRVKDSVGYSIFNTLGVGLWADNSLQNLPDIFAKVNFKVNRAEFTERDRKKQLFLDFDYTYADFPQHHKENISFDFKNNPHWKPFSLKAQVWLETDYFLITKGTFHSVYLDGECHATVECEYDCQTYKVPLPRRYKLVERYDYRDDKLKGVLETRIDFDLRETNPKDPKRFTLSAYGIPEPALVLVE